MDRAKADTAPTVAVLPQAAMLPWKRDGTANNMMDATNGRLAPIEGVEGEAREAEQVGEDSGLKPEVGTENAEEEGEEGRGARGAPVPSNPSRQERQEHELTHTPYRSWCEHCVRARGRNRPHQAGRDDGTGIEKVPRICFDYFFFSDEDKAANKNPMIVMLDEGTGEKYARKVEQKGLGEDGEMEWLVQDMLKELRSWGYQGWYGSYSTSYGYQSKYDYDYEYANQGHYKSSYRHRDVQDYVQHSLVALQSSLH